VPDVTAAFLVVGVIFFVFSVLLPRINEKAVEILSKIMGLFPWRLLSR
jgi:lipopolysaccharide export LptBFGC system permease protein LptF